jgi:hypothetical protein
MNGVMHFSNAEELAHELGVDVDTLLSIENPRPHHCSPKISGVDLGIETSWVWIEDEISPREESMLRQLGLWKHFLYTNTSKDPYALLKTQIHLAEQFGLPL